MSDGFATKPAAMSDEVFKLMGEANEAYVNNRHEEAWDMCKEVIRQFPDIADPYLTMALVAEEKEDHEKAAELNFMACQFNRGSVENWQRAAFHLQRIGEHEREVECYNNILRLARNDESALWDRAMAFCGAMSHPQ